MAIALNERKADARSRLAHLSLTALTLRLMDTWRQSVAQVLGRVPDYETTMIIGAIVSIGADKLIRSDIAPDLQTLENPLPTNLLTRCNVSSVAAAAGLNRETTRRRLNELLEAGIVTKDRRGYRIADGILQLPLLRTTVLTQLRAVRRVINELARLEVISHNQ